MFIVLLFHKVLKQRVKLHALLDAVGQTYHYKTVGGGGGGGGGGEGGEGGVKAVKAYQVPLLLSTLSTTTYFQVKAPTMLLESYALHSFLKR